MANDAKIPDLIREYLLYKGYSNSLKVFDNDVKNDKDKGFRVSFPYLSSQDKSVDFPRCILRSATLA